MPTNINNLSPSLRGSFNHAARIQKEYFSHYSKGELIIRREYSAVEIEFPTSVTELKGSFVSAVSEYMNKTKSYWKLTTNSRIINNTAYTYFKIIL